MPQRQPPTRETHPLPCKGEANMDHIHTNATELLDNTGDKHPCRHTSLRQIREKKGWFVLHMREK